MEPLKTLIVDDEPLARDILEAYVSRMPNLAVAGLCKNALDAFAMLSQHPVDLVLLDINMPEINGIDFLRALKAPPRVIVTTAYPEFALSSYDLDVVDYLLKPIAFERFLKAVNKVVAASAGGPAGDHPAKGVAPDIMFVKSEGKQVKIDLGQLLLVEGLRDYLRLWTLTGRVVIHSTMKSFEELLKTRPNLIRVNKSYIINLHHIVEIDGNIIRLGDHVIPIGNTYRSEVQEILTRYQLI